jgi:hypothetical protein
MNDFAASDEVDEVVFEKLGVVVQHDDRWLTACLTNLNCIGRVREVD